MKRFLVGALGTLVAGGAWLGLAHSAPHGGGGSRGGGGGHYSGGGGHYRAPAYHAPAYRAPAYRAPAYSRPPSSYSPSSGVRPATYALPMPRSTGTTVLPPLAGTRSVSGFRGVGAGFGTPSAGTVQLPYPNSRPLTRTDLLTRSPVNQRAQVQSSLNALDRRNQASLRPTGNGTGARALLATGRGSAGLSTAEKTALDRLAQNQPAVRAYLSQRTLNGAGDRWSAASRVMPALTSPTDKAALSGALLGRNALPPGAALSLAAASSTWGARGQVIAGNALSGAPLGARDLAYLRWRLNGLPLTPAFALQRRALGAAIWNARFLNTQFSALGALAGLSGGSYVPGYLDSGPFLMVPTDPNDPFGPGVDLSVLPGQDDPGAPPPVPGYEGTEPIPLPGEPPSVPKDEPPSLDPARDALDRRQAVRNLRLHNNTKDKVVVYVQYQTRTDKNELAWFPSGKPDGTEGNALQVAVAPGQTVDVADGGWRVNAQAVRIWAKGGGKEWAQFKDKALPLVPEKDGYLAAVPQTMVYAVR